MTTDQEVALMELNASERSAIRMVYVLEALREILDEQQQTFLNYLGTLVAATTGLATFFTFFVAPEFFVVALVVMLAAVSAVAYWRFVVQRRTSERSRIANSYALKADELQRLTRQLEIGMKMNVNGDLDDVMTSTRLDLTSTCLAVVHLLVEIYHTRTRISDSSWSSTHIALHRAKLALNLDNRGLPLPSSQDAIEQAMLDLQNLENQAKLLRS